MKIAFFVSEFPSLSETWILTQITGLLDMGHDVRIYSRSGPKYAREHGDVEKYHLMDKVTYLNIPTGRAARVAKGLALGIKHLFRQPRRVLASINWFKYGSPALSLTLLYASFLPSGEEFDIVHCHFGPNGLIGSFLLEEGWKGRLLVTFHGFDVNSYPLTAGRNVYRKLFDEYNAFTTNTDFTRSQVVKLGCDERKIATIPMSIAIDRFQFAEKKLSPGESVKVLAIGRLCEKKGLAYGLRALAKLAAQGYDFECQIAGDGPLRESLEMLTVELGLSERVRFLGAIEQEAVLRLFAASHILLAPSVTAANNDREGQAVVLQEAQAAGLPVVSTLHNGIPEGVLDGESAFLVPERDSDALAERLAFLFDHPSEWPRMGRAGREFVEGKYSSGVLNERLVKIYNAVLRSRAPLAQTLGE